MIEKAADSAADVIFLDLEDAVAPPEKERRARTSSRRSTTSTGKAKGKTVSVRINGLDTHYMYRDVVDVMEQGGRPARYALWCPRSACRRTSTWSRRWSTRSSRGPSASRTYIEALIETALGMANVEDIARFGGRLEALHFGVADYAASMRARTVNIGGLNPDYPGDQWHAAISRMTIACRAYGLRAD
jgi:citrate lyase beta subunit